MKLHTYILMLGLIIGSQLEGDFCKENPEGDYCLEDSTKQGDSERYKSFSELIRTTTEKFLTEQLKL